MSNNIPRPDPFGTRKVSEREVRTRAVRRTDIDENFDALVTSHGDDAHVEDYVKLGGQIGGSTDVPDIRGLRETLGPTLLTMGDVADGEVLKRDGNSIIGAAPSGVGSASDVPYTPADPADWPDPDPPDVQEALDDLAEQVAAFAGGGTLDQAYDSGGAGAGRTITVDSGAVVLQEVTEGDANPVLQLIRGATGELALYVSVNGEASERFQMLASGEMEWGNGTGVPSRAELSYDASGFLRIGNPSTAGGGLRAANLKEDQANTGVTAIDGFTVEEFLRLNNDTGTLSAGGQLTVTDPWMTAAAASGTADDLDSIALSGFAAAEGIFIIVSPDVGDTITIRDAGVSGGNIETVGGSAIVLDAPEKMALIRRGPGSTYYATALFSSGGVGKVSKSFIFESAGDALTADDLIPQNSIRIPASGKHGTIVLGIAYARCETVGAGTNTILIETSTTLTGSRTTRGTINLGANREASSSDMAFTVSDGMYIWVRCSAVDATAPQKVTVQVDATETVF